MKNTIILVGDYTGSTSYKTKLAKEITRLNSPDLAVVNISYDDLMKGRVPNINNDTKNRIRVMLFYPTEFRNTHFSRLLEQDGLYGGPLFGKAINSYYDLVESVIRGYFGEAVDFINSVRGLKTTRNKFAFHEELKGKVPVTERLYPLNPKDVIDIVKSGDPVFIKVRFGGSGRAITYLSQDEWSTNFIWDGKTIRNRGFGNKDRWPFETIPKDQHLPFLQALMSHSDHLVFEKDLRPPLLRGEKFDFRVYVIEDTVPCISLRANEPTKIVTNWDQGGSIKTLDMADGIPTDSIEKIQEHSLRTAEILGLGWVGLDLMCKSDVETLVVVEGQTDCGIPTKERFDIFAYTAQKFLEKTGKEQ
jgi:hypothetical protein